MEKSFPVIVWVTALSLMFLILLVAILVLAGQVVPNVVIGLVLALLGVLRLLIGNNQQPLTSKAKRRR